MCAHLTLPANIFLQHQAGGGLDSHASGTRLRHPVQMNGPQRARGAGTQADLGMHAHELAAELARPRLQSLRIAQSVSKN